MKLILSLYRAVFSRPVLAGFACALLAAGCTSSATDAQLPTENSSPDSNQPIVDDGVSQTPPALMSPDDPVSEPTDDPVSEPTDDPVSEPTDDPISEPTDDPAQLTPVVRVTEDTSVVVNSALSISGQVMLTGMPVAMPVVHWELLSGPGNAVFVDTSAVRTEVSFDQSGTYVLKLTAFNGSYFAFDTLIVDVEADMNLAPVVNAGRNFTVVLGDTIMLQGSVADDGLPTGQLELEWIQISGPGEVQFDEPTTATTAISVDEAGAYVLELTATDGAAQSTDRVRVEVNKQPTFSESAISNTRSWERVNGSNGSKPTARHEAGGVGFENRFYLMGGRGSRPVNRYSPQSGRWENLGSAPLEMHHFQPVVYNGKIYVIGALTCCFPSEDVVDRIRIFDPATKRWSVGDRMPSNRKRGSAGVVVYNERIYVVGGSTNGHDGGAVNWFDEYNPATGRWRTMPSAPTKRDHFSAAVVNDKLVLAGGRQTDYPSTFENLVSRVDVFDFRTGKWQTAPSIPTPRAGAVVTTQADEVIVIGGETEAAGPAKRTVEAYNVETRKWRTLKPILQGRHGGGIAKIDNAIHIASGNTTRGGGNETTSHEKLDLGSR